MYNFGTYHFSSDKPFDVSVYKFVIFNLRIKKIKYFSKITEQSMTIIYGINIDNDGYINMYSCEQWLKTKMEKFSLGW